MLPIKHLKGACIFVVHEHDPRLGTWTYRYQEDTRLSCSRATPQHLRLPPIMIQNQHRHP
uniref:Uncharacterized protein n=1 Tax=Rhizophora mucronata TaxID=61149 RepID=A0A2P2QFG8_RHIMU